MNNRTILTGLLGVGTVASATAQAPQKPKRKRRTPVPTS